MGCGALFEDGKCVAPFVSFDVSRFYAIFPRLMKRTRLWTLILTLGMLLLVLLILTDWLPYLRGPAPETAEWYWPYRLRPFTLWLKPILGTLLMFGVSSWWLRLGGNGRGVKLGLLALAGASFLLQLALMNADSPHIRDELINRVYSNLDSGFLQTAVELDDLGAALQNYPALMPDFPSDHTKTHPPGLVVANRLTLQFLERFPQLADMLAPPAIAARCIDLWLLDRSTAVAATVLIWAIIPLLAAALLVLPAYWLARLMLPETAVKLAVVLIATIPALLLFAPKSVQLYAPLTLLIFGAFYSGLQKQSWRWFLLSGILLSLASFLSLGNAALGLLLLLYAALHLWQTDHRLPNTEYRTLNTDHRSLNTEYRTLNTEHRLPPTDYRSPITSILAFSLGAVSFWLFYWLGWSVPPWQIAQVGLGQHYDLVTQLRRYDWWLAWNLIDVLVFAGWIVLLGFTAVTGQALKKIRQQNLTAVHMLALSLLLLLILLNISGSARGEVGRIWLFLMPLLALAAASFLAEIGPSWRRQAGLVGLQLLLTLALALAWQPVRAVVVVAQRPLPLAAIPQTELKRDFGETIRLQGYSVEVTDQAIELTLFWEGVGQALRPYTVFNQLLNESGQVVAQKDSWPLAGQWPPTCWADGEKVTDFYTIPLPPDLAEGRYTLLTGWYDARDGVRLVTAVGENSVILGKVNKAAGSIDWFANAAE